MILYEIFMDAFVDHGFNDLTNKIPYFNELGVDMLWLTPFYKAHSYHGYDIKSYTEINDKYGSIDDFIKFVNECHKNNIKVIIDLVLAHTSFHHPWFMDSINGKNDYYHWRDYEPSEKYSTPVSNNSWKICKLNNKYYLAPWHHDMPALNTKSQNVRNEFIKIIEFWLDKGIDGFRLDACPYVDIINNDPLEFWRWFSNECRKRKSDIYLVGEAWDTYEVSKQYTDVLGHSFNFEMAGYIKWKAENPNANIPMNGTENDVYFLSNHDMSRSMSSLNNNEHNMKEALKLLFSMPGDIMLYYGEEIGMKGHIDNNNHDKDVRQKMDWYSVEMQRKNPNSIFSFTKYLIQERKKNNR